MKLSLSLCLLATTSLLALGAADASAKESKPKSNHSFSGGIQMGISTDRNAGSGGGLLRGASRASDDDEDEEDDEDEDEDAFEDDDDVLGDLDLDDDDTADDLDDLEDELDDDGEDEDLDGDGLVDGTEGDDSDGDGIADGDEVGDVGGDTDGDGDITADDAGFELRRAGRAARLPETKRDERLTMKANIGHKYKMGKSGHQWKSGLSYTGANQKDMEKNDNYILALSTGPEFKLMKGDLTLNPSVAYARLSKNSKHIFDTYATSFGAKYKLTKKVALKGKYTYSMQNFASSKPDDVYGQKWAAALAFKPFKDGAGEIGYGFKTVDLTPIAKEKDQHEIKAKYQHNLPMKFYVVGEAGYKWTDFDAAASRRVPVREDEEYTTGLSLGKEVYKDFTLELQYDHRDVETNIRNKDTSNDRFALVGSWKF